MLVSDDMPTHSGRQLLDLDLTILTADETVVRLYVYDLVCCLTYTFFIWNECLLMHMG